MNIISPLPLRKAFVALIITNGLIGVADLSVAIVLIFRGIVISILTSISSSFPATASTATRLGNLLTTLSPHDYAIAIFYFVSHAIIKIFLCWALLKKKLWAYPLAIVFFGLFSLYQIWASLRTHAFFDVLLLLFNAIVLWMVIREYKKVRSILEPVVY